MCKSIYVSIQVKCINHILHMHMHMTHGSLNFWYINGYTPIARYCGAGDTKVTRQTSHSVQTSESDHPQAVARGGQARHLCPAVRSRVVDLRRTDSPTSAGPAKDVKLATHCCGGVRPPSDAHASQLRPYVGLRVVHVG